MHQHHPPPPAPYHHDRGCDHMWGIMMVMMIMMVVATICGAFLAFISGVQRGVAQPADGSSTGLSLLLLLSSSLLLSHSHLDHLSRLCFDQRSIGIRQPYLLGQAKTVLHPNRRRERGSLQNPKLLVLHINEPTMCTTHSRPPGQACRSPPIHPSKPPGHQ